MTLTPANAQIGAARAEYFPRIALTGLLGLESRDLTTLLTAPARTWSTAAGAAAPVFNAGRTRATVRLAEAGERGPGLDHERGNYRAPPDLSYPVGGFYQISQPRPAQKPPPTAR